MEEKRKTVGAYVYDLMQKPAETTMINVLELAKNMQEEYLPDLLECVTTNKALYSGDFFVEVITKNEPLMRIVYKNQFFATHCCPTPNYDQSVFKYNRKDDCVEYIWSIPDRYTCWHLKNNALYVVPEERQLLQFVLDFADGTLYKLCKKLNGEEEDSPFLIKG